MYMRHMSYVDVPSTIRPRGVGCVVRGDQSRGGALQLRLQARHRELGQRIEDAGLRALI